MLYLDDVKEALSVLLVNETVVKHAEHLVNPQAGDLVCICGTLAGEQKDSLWDQQSTFNN